MRFTYEAYRNLIRLLKEQGYNFCKYGSENEDGKVVILRHDVDMSVEKAVEMAKIENEEGVFGTYFILVSTEFYNIHAERTAKAIKELQELGGIVGLHFDETKYDIKDEEDIVKKIQLESQILSQTINTKVKDVSMHRPSKWVLEENIEIPGMINSYSKKYFNDYKYVSDSRMRWKENVEEIVDSGEYHRLHILTHAFWYENEEKTTREILLDFINDAKKERYNALAGNIRDIEEFVQENE